VDQSTKPGQVRIWQIVYAAVFILIAQYLAIRSVLPFY
jgi:hypothetical protein